MSTESFTWMPSTLKVTIIRYTTVTNTSLADIVLVGLLGLDRKLFADGIGELNTVLS